MNKNDSTFFIKKKYNKWTPYIIVLLGGIVPLIVTIHGTFQMKRLEMGVQKDIERIQKKGKKFSDIPKSL